MAPSNSPIICSPPLRAQRRADFGGRGPSSWPSLRIASAPQRNAEQTNNNRGGANKQRSGANKYSQALLVFVRLDELAKWAIASPALTTQRQPEENRYGYAILS